MPIKVYKRKSKNTLSKLLAYLQSDKIQILIMPDDSGKYQVITIDGEDFVVTEGFVNEEKFLDECIDMCEKDIVDSWGDLEVFHAIVASTGTEQEKLVIQYEKTYKEILIKY